MLPASLPQCLCGHCLPGTSAGIQTVQFSLPKNHHESVAAQSVHHRLGDIEHRRHGDGGVNRVATLLEGLQAYLGRQRLA